MTRNKVKLQYITHRSSRKATYNKRKTSLLKKVKELTILCGIEACAIVYGEKSDEPEVWPPGPETLNVLSKFCGLTEFERSKKTMDLVDFSKHRIEKSQEQLRRQILENKKKRFTNFIEKALVNQHNNTDLVNMNELNDMKHEHHDLMAFIDSNIKDVKRKLNSMNVEAEEHVGNGVEAMSGVEQQGNIGNAPGVVNGGDMQGDVHGIGMDTNMGYDMQSGYPYLPWDYPMLPYHMDRDGLDGL